jgi:histidine triad (HIT) family protein
MMCLFCKIIEGELPSYKVYEDEHTLAFLDINPVSDGHVLLVPKYHEQFVENLPDEHYEKLFSVLKKLVKPIQDAFNSPSSNIIINNGQNAGQIIPHVHVHIIPRPKPIGRNFFTTTSRMEKNKEYFEEIAEKIREKIRR